MPAPEAPQNLRVTQRTFDVLTVQWSAVDGAEEYVVAINAQVTAVTAATSYEAGQLQPNTSFTLAVCARSGGENSEWSEVSAFTRPPTPAAPTLTPNPEDPNPDPDNPIPPDYYRQSHSIRLRWSRVGCVFDDEQYDFQVDDVDDVYFNGSAERTVSTFDSPPVQDTELSNFADGSALGPNSKYRVRLRARDDNRGGTSEWSPTFEAFTRPPTPGMPRLTSPAYNARGADYLRLEWTAVDDHFEYDYDLKLNDIEDVHVPGVELAAGVQSGWVFGENPSADKLLPIRPNVRYRLRLRARDDDRGGASFWCDPPFEERTRPPSPGDAAARLYYDGLMQGILVNWAGVSPFHESDHALIQLQRQDTLGGEVLLAQNSLDGNSQIDIGYPLQADLVFEIKVIVRDGQPDRDESFPADVPQIDSRNHPPMARIFVHDHDDGDIVRHEV